MDESLLQQSWMGSKVSICFSGPICQRTERQKIIAWFPAILAQAMFARTFLCQREKGRVLWFHVSIGVRTTGSGCCKTTSRRRCGAPFCVAHVQVGEAQQSQTFRKPNTTLPRQGHRSIGNSQCPRSRRCMSKRNPIRGTR